MPTILVADDDPAIRRTITRMLERAGHEVHSAGTAAEAMALLDRASFDVALIDRHMPGNGRTILESLAASPDFHGRLFLMTGSLPEDVEGLPEGVHRLQKPFDISTLMRLMEGE